MVIDDTGSVEDIHAFIYCTLKIWTGVTDASPTHSLTTLKDSATQLLVVVDLPQDSLLHEGWYNGTTEVYSLKVSCKLFKD